MYKLYEAALDIAESQGLEILADFIRQDMEGLTFQNRHLVAWLLERVGIDYTPLLLQMPEVKGTYNKEFVPTLRKGQYSLYDGEYWAEVLGERLYHIDQVNTWSGERAVPLSRLSSLYNQGLIDGEVMQGIISQATRQGFQVEYIDYETNLLRAELADERLLGEGNFWWVLKAD